MEFFILLVSSLLVSNVILSQILGICPFLGVSKNRTDALGMGLAVIFVTVLSSIITWSISLLLKALEIEWLQLIIFILVIASLVQFLEIVLKKYVPSLYKSLGIYLPLITTNCIVLGTAIANVDSNYDFPHMLVYSLGTSIGYAFVLLTFSAIRERLALTKVPKAFQGAAIALITAGIMALAFTGFAGLV
jgi:electron transport complex protein RnfA